jgi:hypothetical protein
MQSSRERAFVKFEIDFRYSLDVHDTSGAICPYVIGLSFLFSGFHLFGTK